jgi:hypothetical protein
MRRLATPHDCGAIGRHTSEIFSFVTVNVERAVDGLPSTLAEFT